MRSKPQICVGCQLHSHGTDFSAIEGTGANGVMLVGEASGQMEARDQLPFRPYAPAGSVLERCLRRMGLSRQSFSITNQIRCRPRHDFLENAPWEHAAINHCRPNLDAAIRERRPRCIVALGGTALRELTGVAGEALGVTHLAGYVLPLQKRGGDANDNPKSGVNVASASIGTSTIPVLADFHPSYLRRGKASHQGVFSRILKRGLDIASGADREWMWEVDPDDCSTWNAPQGGRLQYWTKPSLEQCQNVLNYLRSNQGLWLAKDLETYESASIDEDAREGFQDTQIRQFQLSYQAGTGIAIPYEGEFKKVIHEFLRLPNQFYGHNWDNFDHKVLRAASAREGWEYAPPVRCFDTLDMFHHWQPDLPAHLQFAASFIKWPFPWKHLAGTNIEFYGICDVDSDLQLGEFLQKMLKADGIWGQGDKYDVTFGYTGQEREVRPVLASMEDRGVPTDNQKRLALGAEFDKAQMLLGEELLPRFPEEAKKPEPYKKLPPELKNLPEDEWGKMFREADRWKCKCGRANNRMDAAQCECGKGQEDGTVKPGKWYRYAQRDIVDEKGSVLPQGLNTNADLNGAGHSAPPSLRWCYIPEFNPNSGRMLIDYMKAKGHKVPKSKEEDNEGNQKDTTNKKELQRLAHKTGDSFYLKVIEYRELTKAKGTYVEGFKPGPDGRVHTTFTFATGTGQLSSRNPNTQNFYAHGPLADAMGRMIAAPSSDMILTKWDYKAFHVLTTGFESECADWMRMARLDMHSLVAGEFLKLWKAEDMLGKSDEELLERFAWLRSDPDRQRVRDKQAKPADLGIGFGEGPRRVYLENMEHFKSEKEAKQFHAILRSLFSKVFGWQERIQMKAHQDKQLVSKFGHIRRFYEVMRWDGKKGEWGHGDQAEEAVAFLPANHAHSHMREVKKDLARKGLDSKYGMCNEVHDAYWFAFKKSLLEEHLEEIPMILRAPSRVLRHDTLAPYGLWCDAEVKVGPNLTDMKKMEILKAGTGVLPKYLGATDEYLTSSPQPPHPRGPLAPAGIPTLPVRNEAPV